MKYALLPQLAIPAHQLVEDVNQLFLRQQERFVLQFLQSTIFAVVHEDIEIVIIKTFDGVNPHQVVVFRKSTDYFQLSLNGLSLFLIAFETDDLDCQFLGFIFGCVGQAHNSKPAFSQYRIHTDKKVLILSVECLPYYQFDFLCHKHIISI